MIYIFLALTHRYDIPLQTFSNDLPMILLHILLWWFHHCISLLCIHAKYCLTKFRFNQFTQHWVIACEKSHKLRIHFGMSLLSSHFHIPDRLHGPSYHEPILPSNGPFADMKLWNTIKLELGFFSVVPLLCLESLPVDPCICIFFVHVYICTCNHDTFHVCSIYQQAQHQV